MRKTIFVAALTALMSLCAEAQEQILNEMYIDTGGQTAYGFHTADIDSVVFYTGENEGGIPGQTYKMIKVYGNGLMKQNACFPVSEINGINFTFRDSRKLYAPKFLSDRDHAKPHDKANSIKLQWEKVEGASGYEVRYLYDYCKQWEMLCTDGFLQLLEEKSPAYCGKIVVMAAEENEILLENLAYDTQYRLAVRALSGEGEEFNSDWSTRYSLLWRHFSCIADKRYNVPEVLLLAGRDADRIRVNFDLNYTSHEDKDVNNDFKTNFEVVDGRFVADELSVAPVDEESMPIENKRNRYKLTAEDVKNGYADITGLQSDTQYKVDILNTGIAAEVDRPYNTLFVYTKPSKVVTHVVDDDVPGAAEYNACCLDNEFSINDDYVGETVFYLEGGKAYYFSKNFNIKKGFTLETLPEDVAAGKRAIVYMGGLPGLKFYNFVLDPDSKWISDITFRNIDFDSPQAGNYGSGTPGLNSFITKASSGIINSLNIESCTFRHFISGFVKATGDNFRINSINCDGNLFYDCGYGNRNGTPDAWFSSSHTSNMNIFGDFRFVNNTIYDSPFERGLVYSGVYDCNWGEDVKWNIAIENNTFINFSTRNNSYGMISHGTVPDGSHFSIQRNLFALVKCSGEDERTLYNIGARMNGGDFTFEIKDNYSTGCLDEHLKDDGIFTSGAFSATESSLRYSFGSAAFAGGNKGTAEDLVVKVGSVPLLTTDLFVSPNPPYNQVAGARNPLDHAAPENILEALKYKQTPEVLNHEIYTKKIGDPRWRN